MSGRIEALAGRLLLFVPVCLGSGIGLYFALPREPGALVWAALALSAGGLALAGARLLRGRLAGFGILALGAALVLAGVLVAGLRTELTRAPVLQFRYYGPVEGRVVKVDRSASNAPRLTLDRVRLERMPPGRRPARVRVSLHGRQGFLDPAPGQIVALTAYLSPPQGPVEPGGFDFRRMAWYDRIGAVGYARSPALLLAEPEAGFGTMMVRRLRQAISAAVRARVPGEAGAFAAAITTGERSYLSPESLADLRAANLAHLLAISGLHMGLLTGFVFAAARLGLALVPSLAARWPIRKIAAVLAIQAGAIYLGLSGGNVATERAFIMVSVLFGAVLLERKALTLRAVAVAATVILLVEPETLAEPGFQMSFAATVALVAVFAALRDLPQWHPPRWLGGPLTVLISSLVAGLATAPFAAAHFNQVSHYGLLANLLSVPVMGLAVMPLVVLATLLAPLGLSGVPLWLMQFPIDWILGVAHWVAGLPGALGHVKSPGPWVLPLIAAGGLAAVLLSGRARLAALVPLAFGFALWIEADRPPGLVSASGGLVGVMGPEGRALSKPTGDSFSARVWLENDGDSASQAEAAARRGFRGARGDRRGRLGAATVAHLTGRGAAGRLEAACAEAALVVVSTDVPEPPGGCTVFDAARLEQTGALALWPDASGLRVVSVAETSGHRPWTGD
ncbi:MAG: ComEC family competence protein [Alphaproteobacteria bacterium]|nr:MAG: ComEC family competence protein [Alphaproteobacteria bacterium]